MSNLSGPERLRLRKLFDENGLDPTDVFQHQHFTCITRTGIEKIMERKGIECTFELEHLAPDFVVIKCYASREILADDGENEITRHVETYGEASKANNRTSYPVAMAEKRAMSRAVLKLCGLYSEAGVIGEDERPE